MITPADIHHYVDKAGNVHAVSILEKSHGTQTSVVVQFSDGRHLAVSEFDVFRTVAAARRAARNRRSTSTNLKRR
ncbi:hypothetical protein [Burkholderia phage vB_BglM_WTB]